MESAALHSDTAQKKDFSLFDDLYEYKGTPFTEIAVTKESLLAVQGYDDVREDDVIVWTYPKAGTHLTIDITSKILGHDRSGEVVQGSRADLWYELKVTPDVQEQFEQHGLFHSKRTHTVPELPDLPSPRVIATHLLYDMLPQKVQDGKAKMIYVHRDPRDMAVSVWYHYNRMGAVLKVPAIPWDSFFEFFKQGKVPWGEWSRHFLSCQNVKDQKHILVLYYEQMIQDLKGTVQKISLFLGKKVSEEEAEAIAASCTFEVTKAARPKSLFIRKGKTGDWKEHFTVAQSEQFNAHILKEVSDHQLSIPYGSFY